MDGSQKQTKAGGVTGAYNLVPAGALQRKRRFVAARFPVAPAGFSKGAEFTLGVDQQQTAAPSKQRDSAPPAAAPPPALLLTNKSLPGNAPGKQLQGVPRTDAIGNYFVLMKAGKDFSVYPLEASYTFKPYTKPSGLTIEEVEAGQRAPATAAAAAGGGGSSLLLPKSMRLAMREQQAAQAADKQLHDDAAPLLKDKLAELAVKYGSGSGSSGSRLVLHASEDEDGGSSDMDFGGDEEEGAAKRKGPKADAARAAAAAGKGKKGKGAAASVAADDIPDDELAEDIYAGEEDELRPERPDKAADWEFVEDAQDDDLGMGGSDEEELEDDPGLRKELGIEEEEEEEEDPEKKEAELGKAAEEAAAKSAAAAAAAGKAAEGGDDMPAGDDEDDDEDLLEVDDDENFDEDYLDRLAKAADEDADGISPQGFKRRKQAAAASSGRYRSPAPGQRGATPPVAAAAAAAAARDGTPGAGKRGATPPSVAMAAALAGQGSGRSATPPGGKRRTPPPGPGAAAAAADRRATPPPQQQQPSAKRKRSDAAAAGGSDGAAAAALPGPAAAAAGPPAPRWAAHQLDSQGVPTTEGVIEALRAMGPIPVQLLALLQQHLSLAPEGKALLKQRLLQVAKVDMVDGVKCMVLKPRAP
uniref:Transcription initiation factor IIF subunit alpha n=1 Tax=Tetradesmus obliquus TaxID=3088 RepID=A0A383W464_TETOB|eukprot:jgi/Sobl393_1/7210/SZX71912.1